MAPVVHGLEKHFDVKVYVTAQHREMLGQVLDLFEIQPDYGLNIMNPGQDLFDVPSNVLLGMNRILARISHKLSTAEPQCRALTALRSI